MPGVMTDAARFKSDMARFIADGGTIDGVRPCYDWTPGKYAVDHQYISMNRWAIDRILDRKHREIHDVGSQVGFLAYLAATIPVTHYDIREPDFEVPGFVYVKGDILDLPTYSGSLEAITCLHVAEHIGLGRYGDEVDPHGFEKACAELSRVLAPGGTLYFAVPTGKPKVMFNAHRVLSFSQVRAAFPGLVLEEFSAITSGGIMTTYASYDHLDNDNYGCGLYRFRKEPK